MDRKEFLKKGFTALGLVAIAPWINACKKDDDTVDPGDGTCTRYTSVTIGPYPTKNPENFVMSDIRSDRQGTQLTTNITLKDSSDNCAVTSGLLVDIWQCDAVGNYSQYGSFTSANFLRGRQTTDSSGTVSFVTIYPGWYSGRTTHIHLHAYTASGQSLVVAQIAFPEATTSTVYAQGAYSGHGQKDTSNASDSVFNPNSGSSLLNLSMATVTGSTSSGYTLTHSVAY